MILANGLIRTLDPSVPTQRALAIAGERIAGGVGVHETALASPDVLDLGGRVVVPGFTDSHVHFPTWALAQNEIPLDGCASLDEALGRLRAAPAPRPDAGCAATAGAAATGTHRRADPYDLDSITGDTPAALIAKDYHSLWLNSAALALAGGDLEVEGGVVERDAAGEPTGVLREESAWRFKERYMVWPDEEYLDAMRAGIRLANSRGVTAVHDKDGWLGALRLWRQLEEAGSLSLRVWQSIPYERVDDARAIGVRSGFGSPYLRLGYLKVFMDGTLGSQTAWMLDGSGVQITSGDELAEIVRRGADAGFPVAVHAIGDRANREALDAFEQTRDAWQPQRPAAAHRARPAALARGLCSDSRSSASPARSSSRMRRQTVISPTSSGPARPKAPTPSGRCSTQAPSSATAATRRSRSSTRSRGSGRACAARSTTARVASGAALTVEQAFHATCVAPAWLAGDERRRGTLIPGQYADLVVLDRDPWDDLDAQVVATMVGGRWVHNPPPWKSKRVLRSLYGRKTSPWRKGAMVST